MRTLRALRPLRAVSRWEGMRVSKSDGPPRSLSPPPQIRDFVLPSLAHCLSLFYRRVLLLLQRCVLVVFFLNSSSSFSSSSSHSVFYQASVLAYFFGYCFVLFCVLRSNSTAGVLLIYLFAKNVLFLFPFKV